MGLMSEPPHATEGLVNSTMINTKRSSARKIVEIPELLSIICSFSSRSQCARLSCVSRRFFTAATPMVWEKVKGVHYLIALIPGTEISSAFAKSQLMTHISSIVRYILDLPMHPVILNLPLRPFPLFPTSLVSTSMLH